MPRVHLPDGRIVHFPEGMPPDQIAAEVAKLSPTQEQPGGFFNRGNLSGAEAVEAAQATSRQPPSRAEAMMLAPAGDIGRLFSKVPVGRIMSAGMAGAKDAVGRIPGVRGAVKAWKASAPPPAAPAPIAPPVPPPAAPVGPMPKPKLNANEVAEYLRKQHGSEQASRMLYGKQVPGEARNLLPRAQAKDAIKRLTPQMESQLPGAAQQAIKQGLKQGDSAQAWQFVTKAPNSKAREFLLSLMRGGQ